MQKTVYGILQSSMPWFRDSPSIGHRYMKEFATDEVSAKRNVSKACIPPSSICDRSLPWPFHRVSARAKPRQSHAAYQECDAVPPRNTRYRRSRQETQAVPHLQRGVSKRVEKSLTGVGYVRRHVLSDQSLTNQHRLQQNVDGQRPVQPRFQEPVSLPNPQSQRKE